MRWRRNPPGATLLRLLLALVLAAPEIARAQLIEWDRRTGTFDADEAFGVAADATGIYLGGYTDGILPDLDRVGKQDAFLRKYDAAGNVLWTRQFGSVFDDAALAVAAGGDGVYVAGSAGPAEADFANDNRTDIFLRRYDANGNLQWSRQVDSIGTPRNDSALAVAVSGNAVYIAGYTRGTLPNAAPIGGFDAFVIRFDAGGNLLWTRQFGTQGIDAAVGLAADSSGVYVLGETDQALAGQHYAGGLFDVFLRKYDPQGTELWTRQFGTAAFEFAGGIAVDAGGVYIAGATAGALPGQTNSFGYDAFVRKYDAAGAELWTRQFGASGDVLAYSVSVSGGNLFLAGNVAGMLPGQLGGGGFNEDVFVRKYSPAGVELWTRQFGSDVRDLAASVAADSGGIYVAGATPRKLLSPEPTGDWDGLLTKLTEAPAAAPIVNAGGVVNAASLLSGAPVAAGSLASVFGLHFAPTGQELAVVHMNGIAAPVFAVTDTQINFQVPWELAGLAQASLTVTVNGVASNTVEVPLAVAAPGLFSTNAAGSGQGAILIANTGMLASAASAVPNARPANSQGVISIYCTGLGAVANQPPTGIAAAANPLSQTIHHPAVRIAGLEAPVLYSGLAPGYVGLYQVNVAVPSGVPAGDAVAVELLIGGNLSNAVTIAIR